MKLRNEDGQYSSSDALTICMYVWPEKRGRIWVYNNPTSGKQGIMIRMQDNAVQTYFGGGIVADLSEPIVADQWSWVCIAFEYGAFFAFRNNRTYIR